MSPRTYTRRVAHGDKPTYPPSPNPFSPTREVCPGALETYGSRTPRKTEPTVETRDHQDGTTRRLSSCGKFGRRNNRRRVRAPMVPLVSSRRRRTVAQGPDPVDTRFRWHHFRPTPPSLLPGPPGRLGRRGVCEDPREKTEVCVPVQGQQSVDPSFVWQTFPGLVN